MSDKTNGIDFVAYDYKEVVADSERVSMYIDSYANFGWTPDENMAQHDSIIKLKRDRKIINKAELTRLERNFEACMSEIDALERAKTSSATAISLSAGIIGTAFMAGSVFAVTHEPPIVWLTILLGLFGFIGWGLPYFLYKAAVKHSAEKLNPLIEAKFDEVYEVCEKGSKLL